MIRSETEPSKEEPLYAGAIERAQRDGARDGLADVYDQHGRAVYGLAVRVCGAGAAEDVLQEVFLQHWRHPDRFDPSRGSLRSFLLTMTHNRAIDFVRSSESRRNRETRSVGVIGGGVSEVAVIVEERAMTAPIVASIDPLPLREREAILLAYFGTQTYREAAVALHIPEGTIKSRIRSGLKRIAPLLTEEPALSCG